MSEGKKVKSVAEMELIMKEVLRQASDAQLNASLNGSRHDGGASELREQVKFYRAGMNMEMPREWDVFVLKTDPDYEKWKKLNKKFGHLR